MNKNYLILPLVVVLIAAAFLAGQFTSMISTSNTLTGLGMVHGGLTCFEVTRLDGAVENLGCQHNRFMNEGAWFIANEMNTSGSGNAVDWIFLGNNTDWGGQDLTAHTDEIFECGLNATNITWSEAPSGAGNLSCSFVWTSTCASIVVNTTGLNCSGCAAGAEFFAANNFTTQATLGNGDQLNVTWYVWSA